MKQLIQGWNYQKIFFFQLSYTQVFRCLNGPIKALIKNHDYLKNESYWLQSHDQVLLVNKYLVFILPTNRVQI